MKKYLCFLLIILSVGCGNVKKVEEPIEKEDKREKYSLVSSENRLVFQKDNNYEIVYYENSKIVKVESAIKFNSEQEAKRHYIEEKYGTSDNIKYVYDVYIVEQIEDYYEDYKKLKKDDLKDYFAKAGYEFISEKQ